MSLTESKTPEAEDDSASMTRTAVIAQFRAANLDHLNCPGNGPWRFERDPESAHRLLVTCACGVQKSLSMVKFTFKMPQRISGGPSAVEQMAQIYTMFTDAHAALNEAGVPKDLGLGEQPMTLGERIRLLGHQRDAAIVRAAECELALRKVTGAEDLDELAAAPAIPAPSILLQGCIDIEAITVQGDELTRVYHIECRQKYLEACSACDDGTIQIGPHTGTLHLQGEGRDHTAVCLNLGPGWYVEVGTGRSTVRVVAVKQHCDVKVLGLVPAQRTASDLEKLAKALARADVANDRSRRFWTEVFKALDSDYDPSLIQVYGAAYTEAEAETRGAALSLPDAEEAKAFASMAAELGKSDAKKPVKRRTLGELMATLKLEAVRIHSSAEEITALHQAYDAAYSAEVSFRGLGVAVTKEHLGKLIELGGEWEDSEGKRYRIKIGEAFSAANYLRPTVDGLPIPWGMIKAE